MKTKIPFWMLAAFAAFSTFGETTPMASQPWVRMVMSNETANMKQWVMDYVGSGELFQPSKITVKNDAGEDEVVTMNFIDGKNRALRIDESNVDGMATGTVFALVSENTYANATNSACTFFSGASEQWGYELSDGRREIVTNGVTVTTNTVYATTNEHYIIRFTADIGGAEYRSVTYQNGVHEFFTETDSDKYIRMVACKITDAEKSRILSPPNANARRRGFSWLELIFPSAYAIVHEYLEYTSASGESGMTPWYEETKDGTHWKRTTYFKGQYLTDENDAGVFGVGNIQWGDNTFAIEHTAFEIEAGVDVVSVLKSVDELIADKENQINEIKSEIAKAFADRGEQRLYTNLSRALTPDGKNALNESISVVFDDLKKYIDSHKFRETVAKLPSMNDDGSESNPYFYTEVQEWEEDEDEPEPPDEPKVFIPPSHKHKTPRGHTCGQYKCPECGVYFNPNGYPGISGVWPLEHNYQWRGEGKGCKWCMNLVNGQYCHVHLPDTSTHTDWHGTSRYRYDPKDGADIYPSPFYYQEGSNGKVVSFIEQCYGGAITKPHMDGASKLTPTNLWFRDDRDPNNYCRHVRYCSGRKYPNLAGNKEICGFGLPYAPYGQDSAEWNLLMMKSGVWTSDYQTGDFDTNDGRGGDEQFGHYFRGLSYLGQEDVWSNKSEQVCAKKVVCAHDRKNPDEHGVYQNCGCGKVKWVNDTHESTNVVTAYIISDTSGNPKTQHGVTRTCLHKGCGYTYQYERPHAYNDPNGFVTNYLNSDVGHVRMRKCDKSVDVETLGWNIVTVKPCGYLDVMATNRHDWSHLNAKPFFINSDEHGYTNWCATCGYVSNGIERVAHSDLEYGSWVQVDNFYHAHSIRCKTCDHVIAHHGDTTEHDGLSYAIEKDVFQSYPQQTNFVFQTHSSGRYDPDTGEWTPPRFGWIDITGGHIGENPCYTCGGHYQDLTWRACKYESIGSFKHFNQSENVLTCDNCHNEIKTPRLQGLRYLNSTYHADYCCRDIGGVATRCTPYLDAEEHYHYEGGNRVRSQPGDYCEGCDTMVESEPFDGNLKIPNGNDDLDNTTFLYVCALLGLRQPLSDNDEPVNNFNGDDPVYRVMPHALEGMFKDCAGLETVYLNYCTNALEGAMKDAFVNCSSLRYCGFDRLELADTESFSGAFSNCHSLASLNLPNLREIGDRSFERNNKLLEVTLPKATNIGERAFADCGRLRYVYFTGCSEIPHLKEPNAFYGLSEDAAIIVPHALYDEWRATTNWSEIANMILSDSGYGTNCDFYVSARIGSDAYDGLTPDTPKKTIDAAISLATNNQVIGVMDGHYAYPEFFNTTSTDGSAYPVTIVGLSDGNVFIDTPNSSGRGFITGCSHVWTAFENVTFRNLNKGTTSRWAFLFTYLYNCVVEDSCVTQRAYRGIFCVSVLERCKVRNLNVNGYGGSGTSTRELNPVVFDDCILFDSEIELTTTPQTPGAGNISLGNVAHVENCYLKGGNYYSLELYYWTNSHNFVEADARWYDSTIIPDKVIMPNGWCKTSYGGGNLPIRLDNCLVGVDSMTLNQTEHVNSIVTNRETMVGAIDPETKKPDSEHADWRAHGYRGLPVSVRLNGANKFRYRTNSKKLEYKKIEGEEE